VYELYARGPTYEELHEQNRSLRHLWEKYIPDTSFKFAVNGYNRSISKTRQVEIIDDFAYTGLMGKIDVINPEVTMGCFEECKQLLAFDKSMVNIDDPQIRLPKQTDPARASYVRYSLAGWYAGAVELHLMSC
jgi:hypothetical protein